MVSTGMLMWPLNAMFWDRYCTAPGSALIRVAVHVP
jgi:hypothetical protein